MLALTSSVLTRAQVYDAASTIMAQKLSQVSGVGQVTIGGSSLPAVRVELNPAALNKFGIGMEQVRSVLSAANANTPKGHVSDGQRSWEVGANDQIFTASDYARLVVAYSGGSAVRISDVGYAEDSEEDLRNSGYANGKPSVLIIIFRQPGANIIDTVDRIRAVLPQITASIPQSIAVKVAMDQTVTIRASIRDTEKTLLLSVLLVIVVVFLFLGDVRTTLIPSVVVPVSLVGTWP
jgi:multidrug efflux pump